MLRKSILAKIVFFLLVVVLQADEKAEVYKYDDIHSEKKLRQYIENKYPDLEWLFYHYDGNHVLALARKGKTDRHLLYVVPFAGLRYLDLKVNGKDVLDKTNAVSVKLYQENHGLDGSVAFDKNETYNYQLGYWIPVKGGDVSIKAIFLQNAVTIKKIEIVKNGKLNWLIKINTKKNE